MRAETNEEVLVVEVRLLLTRDERLSDLDVRMNCLESTTGYFATYLGWKDLKRQSPPRVAWFPFLANQRPSAGSPSSSSTLNPSSAISIANSPPDTNSPRFTANSPPSSHDPSNDIFSMDWFNSLSSSS
ncbi:hypothetical protein PGTUg99_036547 [Puccinia graminis f. sp. tritici]|uniref:Uncharacterized protein n=1 Tax=Puccinia graminis f. sp. tritici TaxID=56615 RepID=A0A5B0PQ80_PUCGR|nr:hypothetical protein PGTUg99_036547 [Puccinia graminis f. sp. tritici]